MNAIYNHRHAVCGEAISDTKFTHYLRRQLDFGKIHGIHLSWFSARYVPVVDIHGAEQSASCEEKPTAMGVLDSMTVTLMMVKTCKDGKIIYQHANDIASL